MGQFVADPQILRIKGMEVSNLADQFLKNVNDIYSEVNNMVTNNYVSPDAVAIANEIETYHGSMNMMGKIFRDYANFCVRAGNEVYRTQNSIIDEL